MSIKFVQHIKIAYKKSHIPFKPIFLIGCGRSGTTILGSTLGRHPSIKYLNERRDIWHQAYPNLDIWSDKEGSPKLIANKQDLNHKRTKELKSIFHKEQVRSNNKVLLEKLPINNFRLDFIHSAFPNAKYIYLHRNGLEVAKSIEKRIKEDTWYKGAYKWTLIEKLAKSKQIPTDSLSQLEKGLLEWRFSLQFSEQFFSQIPTSKYYSLSYQSFIEEPKTEIENILKFMHLNFSSEDIYHMIKDVKRRTEIIKSYDPKYNLIGGEHLKLSIENKLRHTSQIVCKK